MSNKTFLSATKRLAPSAVLLVAANLGAASVHAQSTSSEIDDLKKTIRELQHKVESIEAKQAQAAAVQTTNVADASKSTTFKGIQISDFLDNVKLAGDLRTRYEYRKADGIDEKSGLVPASQELDRARYAYHLGLTANAGDFFSEVRVASNTSARSPNVDFAQYNSNDGPNSKFKGSIYIDRAYIGWNPTRWLTLVAGRMSNLNYVSTMTWDRDITPEGLTEQLKYDLGPAHFFANASQWYLQSKYNRTDVNGTTVTATTLKEFPVQLGLEYDLSPNSSFKIAPMFATYAGSADGTKSFLAFDPGYIGNPNVQTATTVGAQGGVPVVVTTKTATAYGDPHTEGVNNLRVIDVPMQLDALFNGYGLRLWGDFAYNLNGNRRADDAAAVEGGGIAPVHNQNAAWLVGVQFGSSPDLKTWKKRSTYWADTKGMNKHDWSGWLWYQHIEAFALNPNQIDSDIMNAQVNMAGWAASGVYMLNDNFFATLTYAHGTRINSLLGTGYSVDTSGVYPNTYDMIQADLTFKF